MKFITKFIPFVLFHFGVLLKKDSIKSLNL